MYVSLDKCFTCLHFKLDYAFILHLDFDNFYKNGSKENHQLIRITYKNFSKNQ